MNMNEYYEHMKAALTCLIEAKEHLTAAGFHGADFSGNDELDDVLSFMEGICCDGNADDTDVSEECEPEAPKTILLEFDLFEQMVDDILDLGEMVQELTAQNVSREHLLRTLVGVATKLEPTSEDHLESRRMLTAVTEIAARTDDVLNQVENIYFPQDED